MQKNKFLFVPTELQYRTPVHQTFLPCIHWLKQKLYSKLWNYNFPCLCKIFLSPLSYCFILKMGPTLYLSIHIYSRRCRTDLKYNFFGLLIAVSYYFPSIGISGKLYTDFFTLKSRVEIRSKWLLGRGDYTQSLCAELSLVVGAIWLILENNKEKGNNKPLANDG